MVGFRPDQLFNTYSIVARDHDTGDFGVAVQTHQMGVGRVVPWLKPGYGACATQSLANISFGPMALTMLQEGLSAQHVIDALVASDANSARRQVAVVDANGHAAAHTGDGCIAYASHHVGNGYSVQANMMTRDTVIPAMREAFESATGDLAARMMAAMFAAQKEDGDIRGMQSAALVVVPGTSASRSWASIYDLRVDEHARPLEELARLVSIRRAQHVDSTGYALLDKGDLDSALVKWQEARELAPDQEELAFWQAVTLTDRNPGPRAVEAAAEIFDSVFHNDERRVHWVDLIRRLAACGLIQREGAGDELIAAIRSAS